MSGKRMIVLAMIVTLLLSLLYVRSRFWVVELSYLVSQRQEEKAQLEQSRRSLSLELATMRNPKRVERRAWQELKLERPQDVKSVVFVREARREIP